MVARSRAERRTQRAGRGGHPDETAFHRRCAASRRRHGRGMNASLVVHVHDGLGCDPRAHGPTRQPRGSARHRLGHGKPIASSSGRAFTTTPRSPPRDPSPRRCLLPPTGGCVPSAIAKVRIVSARSKSPFGRTTPSAPIDAPRPTGSSAAMWSMAAIFGAPVTEPPGNVASSTCPNDTSSRSVPSTSETRCSTPASGFAAISSGHVTEPVSQTREIVAFEVDDHHVLGGVLVRLHEPALALGRVPLIGSSRRAPTPREEDLGRRRDDRPPVPDQRARLKRSQGASRAAHRRDRR